MQSKLRDLNMKVTAEVVHRHIMVAEWTMKGGAGYVEVEQAVVTEPKVAV